MRSLRGVFVCCALVLGSARALGQAAPAPDSPEGNQHLPSRNQAPEGLSSTDWSSIHEAYEASRHAAFAVPGGYQARNPGQQWLTRFDGRGFSTKPDIGGWSWGLQLVRYGFSGQERAVAEPTHVSAAGQRVVYDWDTTIQEWYVNDSRGLEHGYTVHVRPPKDQQGPLILALAVRGELTPRVQVGGRGVRFVNSDDTAVLTYAGLAVFDADGQSLAARFEPLTHGLLLTIDERDARYPLTIDPLAQQAYLKASNTGMDDEFGSAVATTSDPVSGDLAVVGAPRESSAAVGVNGNQSDNSAALSGAVYVFVRSGTSWSQQAYLKASNTGPVDLFGTSVAVDHDRVVVGAPLEDSSATGVNGNQADNGTSASGAAYVFVRSGTTWSQEAYLKASNTAIDDRFGQSVSISNSGATMFIGAPQEDSQATGVNGDQLNNNFVNSGAAYAFERTGGTWTQVAYVKASHTGTGDEFGGDVAVSDETAVVGATWEASNATGVGGNEFDNTAAGSGAAYVFVRQPLGWSQQSYLKASNTGVLDHFGDSVAVSGDTVVVGATHESSNAKTVNGDQTNNGASSAGAAYVFARNGTTWSQQAYLKASNSGASDFFGWSVAAQGDTVAVGAFGEDSNGIGVDGNPNNNSAASSGAAYVFMRNSGNWVQQSYLKASNADAGDFFGRSVAAWGKTVVVGAPHEASNATGVNGNQSDDSVSSSGAAYVFLADPWIDLGFGLASLTGTPHLVGTGTLEGGTFVTTTVSNLVANGVAFLVVGLSPINAPFKGGVLVPALDLVVGVPTGPNGLIDLPTTWPMNIPSGFAFYEQYWQKYAPGAFTASNAIKGTTP